MESRGNLNYTDMNGIQIGLKQITSSLHFGPQLSLDGWQMYVKNNRIGYNHGFYTYKLVWNEQGIKFFVNGIEIGFASVDNGFWKRGEFVGKNIWINGTKMAPFDEEVKLYSIIFMLIKC